MRKFHVLSFSKSCCIPRRSRSYGGIPVISISELAERSKLSVLHPERNPMKILLDRYPTRPQLGLFNDIPVDKFRASEARAWALAGFSFVVNDGEHSTVSCIYGREQNETLIRLGLTPIQRLAREARSQHGDSLATGSRGTMRPYGTTVQDCVDYLSTISFPSAHEVGDRRFARGAFPVRLGNAALTFTPESLREVEEGQIMAFLQFETSEYLLDTYLQTILIALLAERGPNASAAFVGALDFGMRARTAEEAAQLKTAIANLCSVANSQNVPVGCVAGGATPKDTEEAILAYLRMGVRLIAPPLLASDFPLVGAYEIARPFHRAVERFEREKGSVKRG